MINDRAKAVFQRMFPGEEPRVSDTDPDFLERFGNFSLGEASYFGGLDDRTRLMAILAALMGCQGIDEFGVMLPAALNVGVTPVEVKEIVYQATAYLGVGRVLPFLGAVNKELVRRGVELPLPSQANTTMDTRLEAGVQAQVDIFGEGMREFYKSGPEETRHINRWLAENCFGDWYTRGGLDLKTREMITFCFIAAQGGCEMQLTAHAGANLRLGNDDKFLIAIVSQCLPYIGYPRSLNALRCVSDAVKQQKGEQA
jgi:4-carboxymuconolactone decarboxylase